MPMSRFAKPALLRTVVYLTDEQQRFIDAQSNRTGLSRSDYIRKYIDREMDRFTLLPGVPVSVQQAG